MKNSLKQRVLLSLSFGLAMAVGNEGQNRIARDEMFGLATPALSNSKLTDLSAVETFNNKSRFDNKRAQQTAKRLSQRHNRADLKSTAKQRYALPYVAKPKAPKV